MVGILCRDRESDYMVLYVTDVHNEGERRREERVQADKRRKITTVCETSMTVQYRGVLTLRPKWSRYWALPLVVKGVPMDPNSENAFP